MEVSIKRGYLIANFGGPRSEEEVEPFLCELLSDQDVLRTGLPACIHRFVFRQVARFRAPRIRKEYEHMGGKSPIFEDTEKVAERLREVFQAPTVAFHRYLPSTHASFLDEIAKMQTLDEIIVFPLFPQYSYATTGSLARWMKQHLSEKLVNKLRWIPHYCDHPLFIQAYSRELAQFLEKRGWKEEDTCVLCSFHGLPQSFIKRGDPYQSECERSFHAIAAKHPKIHWQLAYQSKFGPGAWLKPYTQEIVQSPLSWSAARRKIVIMPLAFTSDHIETLSEIENLYLPPLRQGGCEAARLPALENQEAWILAIQNMIQESQTAADKTQSTHRLIPF